MPCSVPGWRVKPSDELCDPDLWQRSWGEIFCYVNNQLYAIAGDPAIDVKAQQVDELVLPPGTRAVGSFNGILPVPVQQWVLRERTRKTLADLVVLLIVIASLGSLIFLSSDSSARPPGSRGGTSSSGPYSEGSSRWGCSSPTWDCSAFFVSTGGIFEVRPEGLYLLALGAGLFTDRVYEYLRKRVEAATHHPADEEPGRLEPSAAAGEAPKAEGQALHSRRETGVRGS